ncbi:Uncharacterized protein TCM_038297 [Theobroma cacao]|uniref:Uncharacterized protein n=1 Tax=Theobroma cacao TaxID=3641 RepID=A0A061GP95_THECC|nr:Uncharacterized protein TCM_038297 [Theobroma cacao]
MVVSIITQHLKSNEVIELKSDGDVLKLFEVHKGVGRGKIDESSYSVLNNSTLDRNNEDRVGEVKVEIGTSRRGGLDSSRDRRRGKGRVGEGRVSERPSITISINDEKSRDLDRKSSDSVKDIDGEDVFTKDVN